MLQPQPLLDSQLQGVLSWWDLIIDRLSTITDPLTATKRERIAGVSTVDQGLLREREVSCKI